MNPASIAIVSTPHGSRYLQQLCKHWAHNLEVSFTPERGTVLFPANARGGNHRGDGLATFVADDGALNVRLDASSPDQLESLKGAVARHIDRFAFREGPLSYEWRDTD
jgi:hypothetical protein